MNSILRWLFEKVSHKARHFLRQWETCSTLDLFTYSSISYCIYTVGIIEKIVFIQKEYDGGK